MNKSSTMKSLFVAFVLCFSLGLSAQVITVSEDINVNNDVGYEVLGELGNHVLLFRDSRSEFKIQAFNRQMHEAWTKELELDKRSPKYWGSSRPRRTSRSSIPFVAGEIP